MGHELTQTARVSSAMKNGTSFDSFPVSGVMLLNLAFALTTSAATVTGEVTDASTGQTIPSRVYIRHAHGRWLFPESTSSQGSAVRYQKRNWLNTNAVEFHT